MGKFVSPAVYFLGYPVINWSGLSLYLRESGNGDFIETIDAARATGLSDAEILCSFYAKLCYKSLTVGHNANLTKVRDIEDNLRSILDTGHGSILEHVQFNFVVTDCSRIYTHEQCRHRAGAAYSQTSGRYCRLDKIDVVFDPLLEPARDICETLVTVTENGCREIAERLGLDGLKDFALKKKITSAIRRFAPNGQSNEMGMTLNLRTLRHTILLRTARHAEWEIRVIYGQIYNIVSTMYPLMFSDARTREVDGLTEVYGMKMQPYEMAHDDLSLASDSALLAEVNKRSLLGGANT